MWSRTAGAGARVALTEAMKPDAVELILATNFSMKR